MKIRHVSEIIETYNMTILTKHTVLAKKFLHLFGKKLLHEK